jgi:hypothetical protein
MGRPAIGELGCGGDDGDARLGEQLERERVMTTASAFTTSGFTHELLLHDSLEEMLAFVVPFVRDGLAAHEPMLLLVRPSPRRRCCSWSGRRRS